MAESDAYKLRNQVSAIAKIGTHHMPCDALEANSCTHVFQPDTVCMWQASLTLVMQVPGWKVEKTEEGTLCLRQEWKVRDFSSGIEFFKRIGEVAEAEGHHPDLHLEGYNKVSAGLSTHSIGMLVLLLMSSKCKSGLLV